jgi:hypothetical protein
LIVSREEVVNGGEAGRGMMEEGVWAALTLGMDMWFCFGIEICGLSSAQMGASEALVESGREVAIDLHIP